MSDPFAANVCGARRRVLLLTVAGGEPGSQPMREAGTQELGGLTAPLVDLIRLTSTAMSHATAALFSIDPAAAESIAAAYETVSALRRELEDHAAVLLALRAQSRVPELPVTIAAVHVNAEAERMGQLAREVADIARTRRAWASIPAPLLDVLRELSEVCLDIAVKAANVVETHGKVGVAEADRGEEADRLEQSLFEQLLSWSVGMDARAYERYAEHAVRVAHRAALLAVGAPRS